MGLANILVYVALIALPASQGLSQESVRYSVKSWLEALQSHNLFTQMNVAYGAIDFDTNPQNSASVLISALKLPDANVRRYVVNALAELPIKPETVVPVLVEALRDKDEQVREHAVIALAKVGSPAVPALVKALKQVSVGVDASKRIGKDGQTDVRLSDLASVALWKSEASIVVELFNLYRKNLEHQSKPSNRYNRELSNSNYLKENIALIIGKRGASAVPELIPDLKDKNTAVRSLALASLASIGSEAKSAIPEILAIAKGTDKSLSQQAVSTLGRFGVSAVPALADVLLNHPNPEIRSAAAYTLWWNKDHSTIPHLVKALQIDVSPKVRASAARSLAEIGLDDVSAVMALLKALKDRDFSVQENAAYALSVIIKQSSPAAKVILPDLIEALKVPNGKVQSEVASVLGHIGKEANAAVPVIIGGLSAPPKFKIGEGSYYADPQHSFISTLGKIGVGDSNAVSVLIEILKDPSRKSLHDSSATALGELGSISRPAVPLLVKKYRNAPDVYSRRDTANALVMIQPSGTFALLEILQNPNENKELRLSACDALEPRLQQDKHIIRTLRQFLQDSEPSIRLCAAQQLASTDNSTEVVLPILEEAFLKGKQWEARESFEQLGSKSVSTILRLLEKHPSQGGDYLIETLGKISSSNPQDSRIVPALIRSLQNPNRKIRENAAKVLGELDPVNAPGAVRALVALLEQEIKPGAEFRGWRQEGCCTWTSYPVPASAAFSSLQKFGPSAKEAMPAMIQLLSYPDVFVRRNAIQVLGRIGAEAKSTKNKLIVALSDADPSVRVAAAQALLDIGFELDELKPIFTAVAVDDYINRQLKDAYYDIAETLRPSGLISGRFKGGLPPFPWPNPPRPAHIAVVGRDLPRNLLGTDSTTLQTVYQRLFNTLVKTDPGFESSLFGVPGGFALLAKIERIQEDGAPFPGKYRWVEGKFPPLDLKDYVGRLFLEKSGYFRVIAFVITTEDYRPENPSAKPLPEISEGAQDLPDEIARDRFKGKHGYILIYSFKRKQGGEIREFKISSLSALAHLEKSGILSKLKTLP